MPSVVTQFHDSDHGREREFLSSNWLSSAPSRVILSAVTNCAFGTVTLELSSSLQSMGSDHFRSISKSAIYGRAEYIWEFQKLLMNIDRTLIPGTRIANFSTFVLKF